MQNMQDSVMSPHLSTKLPKLCRILEEMDGDRYEEKTSQTDLGVLPAT